MYKSKLKKMLTAYFITGGIIFAPGVLDCPNILPEFLF